MQSQKTRKFDSNVSTSKLDSDAKHQISSPKAVPNLSAKKSASSLSPIKKSSNKPTNIGSLTSQEDSKVNTNDLNTSIKPLNYSVDISRVKVSSSNQKDYNDYND